MKFKMESGFFPKAIELRLRFKRIEGLQDLRSLSMPLNQLI